jgi:hypothetical protein
MSNGDPDLSCHVHMGESQTFAHLDSCATATLFPAPAATFATCRQCTIFPLLLLHHGAPPCVTREKWGGGGRQDGRATMAQRRCNTPNNNSNRLGGVFILQDNNKTKVIEIYA